MNTEKIAVVTDSCADIPSSLADNLNITVVPLQVIFGEKTYQDGIDIVPEQFYEMLSNAKNLPTTAQPSPRDFSKVYSHLLDSFDKVLSIHLSEKLSGTFQSAYIAAKEFTDRVITWDSASISVGVGVQVHAAVEALNQGKPLQEICAMLKKIKETSTTMFTLDTLEYLEKGGRIGKAASLLGSVLNIKPIIKVEDGYYHAYGKARSQKKALKTIVNHFAEVAQKQKVTRLAIGHGMAYEAAEFLKKELEQALGILAIMTSQVGPVIGVHTGPGAVGATISHY